MQPIIRCKVGRVRAPSVHVFKRVCAEVGEEEKANYSTCACISSLGSHNKRPFFSLCSTVLLLMFCHRQFGFFLFFFRLSFVCFSAQIIPPCSQFQLHFHRSRSNVKFSDFFFLVEFKYPSAFPAVFAIFFCQGQRWL